MNQIKIGKFIADCRKRKGLTQLQLSEKLGITDRAVSKWENGKGMPDSSLMLELCDELDISVNELLSGEIIEMKEYDKKAEELLLEMAKREEEHNKRHLTAMWLILITDLLFYMSVLIPSAMILGETLKFAIIASVATVIFLIIGFIALKFEVEAGYYECRKCRHRFIPSYMKAMMSMHISTTRFMKCPECGKFSWCKKVLSKNKMD